MTNNDFIKQLEDMDVPNIKMKNHQVMLRRALLTSSHWDTKSTHWYEFFWKGGENMKFAKIFPIGAVAVMVIMFAAVFAFGGSFNAKPVNAQEIVKAAYTKGVALPADQLSKLNAQLGADMLASLEEAKNAPDLQIVSADALKNGAWAGTQNPTINQTVGKDILSGEDVKLLRYTDAKGIKTILAIDEDNNVLMKLVAFDAKDMQKMTTPDGQEMFGIPATQVAPAQ